MIRINRLLLLSATVLASGSAARAQVEGQPEASSDEIVVTAQRRAQALSDVGLSITAIGGEALEKRNFDEAEDLAALVPGLSISNSGFATPLYTLRGVGINEPSVGSSSSVAIYVDEVPLAYPITTQGAALDLERVEVLKGPQGTLYGQNSTGGAINYIANKPTDEFAAGISGTIGRFARGNIEGYVSGPIAPTLKVRIAGRASFGNGWQKSITSGRKHGDIENYSGRAIVEWEPSDIVRLTWNLNGWLDKSDTQASQLQAVSINAASVPAIRNAPIAPQNARAADWGPELGFGPFVRDDKFWQSSLRAEIDISDSVTLTSITGYSDFKRYQYSDTDGIAGAAGVHQRQTGKINAFSQEIRLSAEFDPGINWVVGANYTNDDIEEVNFQILPDLNSFQNLFGFKAFGSISDTAQKIKSAAVFTNIDIALTSQLTLTGGLRISEEKRDFTGCARAYDAGIGLAYTTLLNNLRGAAGLPPLAGTILPGDCYTIYATNVGRLGDRGPLRNLSLFTPGVAHRRLKEDNTPWNIGLNFKPTADSLIYARVSRGFKSGNFATIGLTDNSLYGPVVQEELTAYELGGRLFLRPVLSLEGAVFRYDYNNKQLRARIFVGPPFGNVSAQDNIPKSRVQGAEFSAVLRPVSRLSLGFSGVYLDSKIKEYIGFTVNGTTRVDLAGAPFNFTPKWSLNADINYSYPIKDDLDVFVGLNAAYRSKTSAVFVPTGDTSLGAYDIDSYTLIDGQIGIENPDKGWRAFLWGKNIFNKYYWTNTIRQGDVTARFAGLPATYGATISYKF